MNIKASPFLQSKRADTLAKLADARARFATSLEGRWFTARGTADRLMCDCWDFRSDGTVHITFDSVWSGRDEDVYLWRAEGPFQIGLGYPPDEESSEALWVSVHYDFEVLENEEGENVVLHQVDKSGFWISDAPLRRA